MYLLGFVVLNLLLKSLYLNSNEIAGDEPFSIRVALMPVPDILSFLSVYNNPPLFELLLSVLVKTFGVTLPWVRLLSLISSSLTVVYIYLIGSRFFSKQIAITASLLFTFATFQVSFSHEARVYALFNLLCCASVYYFLIVKDKNKLGREHLFFGLVCLLLIYSHYFGCVLLFIEFLWLLLVLRKQARVLIRIVGIWVACLLLYAPQLYLIWGRFGNNLTKHWVEQPALGDLYINLMKMLNAPVTTVGCCLLFAAASVLWFKKRGPLSLQSNTLFVVFWFVCGYGGLFLVSYFVPVFLDRYLIFVSGALYLLIPLCIAFLCKASIARFVHPAFVLLFVFSLNLNPSNGRNWSKTIEQIRETKTTKTAVVIIPDWIQNNFSYHYNISYFTDYHNTSALLAISNCFAINSTAELNNKMISRFDSIIFIDGGSQFVDPDRLVLTQLQNSFHITQTTDSINGLTIYYLSKTTDEN
jgi:mannosyltransferase